MAKLEILAGTTSKLIDVFIQDSSSTTGAGLTGLTSGSSGLTWYYYREGAASATSVSPTSMTLGTFTSSGFIVIDGSNMPGCYQLGVPNAAIAAGAKSVIMLLKGVTNMAPLVLEIELTATDNQDAVRGGLTALPNANAAANGGLPTIGATIPNATAGAANGLFIAGTNAATTVTTSFTTTFTGNLTGSVASVVGAVGSVTGNVGGNVTGSVGSVVGAVGSVTGAVGSVTGNVGGNVVGTVASVVGNVGGNVTGTVGSVVGAVGSVTGNVGGNVTGTVASVVGNVGGNVTGTVASVVGNVGGNVTGSVGSVSSVSNIVTAVFAQAIETGMSFLQSMRLISSATGAKLSGGATTTNTFRNAVADDKDRIVATVDSDGNRTAITYDLT